HPAGAVGEVPVGEGGVRPARDGGVVDAGHALGAVQAPGEDGGVGADLACAQVEGLDADQDLLGAGGGQGGPEVGDVLGAGVGQQAGAAAVVLRREGDAETGVGRGQARPAVRTSPGVEGAGVDDDASEGGAVAAQVLGGGVDDHVGPVLAGPVQSGAGEGGVDDDGDVAGVGEGADRGEVHQLRTGVRDRLHEHGA